MKILVAALAVWAAAGAVQAGVAEQWETGFTLRNTAEVSVQADRAYAGLAEIGRWWASSHTYSGDAANLRLDLQPGGCFCEALPGGGVAHGAVVLAWPAQRMVRIDTALGPLQEMGVSGALTFQIRPKGAGAAEVVQTYTVSGGRPGMSKAMASIVDGVIAEQLLRFKAYVESGRPD